jgi:hypothetical protein
MLQELCGADKSCGGRFFPSRHHIPCSRLRRCIQFGSLSIPTTLTGSARRAPANPRPSDRRNRLTNTIWEVSFQRQWHRRVRGTGLYVSCGLFAFDCAVLRTIGRWSLTTTFASEVQVPSGPGLSQRQPSSFLALSLSLQNVRPSCGLPHR